MERGEKGHCQWLKGFDVFLWMWWFARYHSEIPHIEWFKHSWMFNNHGCWFSHSSGGWTPNIKVPSGLVSGENALSDLCTPAFLLCPHSLSSVQCTSVSLSRGAPVSLPLIRSAVWSDYSPTLRTSCNVTSLSPSTVTLRIRAPTYEFCGDRLQWPVFHSSSKFKSFSHVNTCIWSQLP